MLILNFPKVHFNEKKQLLNISLIELAKGWCILDFFVIRTAFHDLSALRFSTIWSWKYSTPKLLSYHHNVTVKLYIRRKKHAGEFAIAHGYFKSHKNGKVKWKLLYNHHSYYLRSHKIFLEKSMMNTNLDMSMCFVSCSLY